MVFTSKTTTTKKVKKTTNNPKNLKKQKSIAIDRGQKTTRSLIGSMVQK